MIKLLPDELPGITTAMLYFGAYDVCACVCVWDVSGTDGHRVTD